MLREQAPLRKCGNGMLLYSYVRFFILFGYLILVAEMGFKRGTRPALNYWTTVSTVANNYERAEINETPGTEILHEISVLLVLMALRPGVIGTRSFKETCCLWLRRSTRTGRIIPPELMVLHLLWINLCNKNFPTFSKVSNV
jgi:hypothetical protein